MLCILTVAFNKRTLYCIVIPNKFCLQNRQNTTFLFVIVGFSAMQPTVVAVFRTMLLSAVNR